MHDNDNNKVTADLQQVKLNPHPQESELHKMHGPLCPPGECQTAFAERNSYGTMYKCTQCGAEDFAD